MRLATALAAMVLACLLFAAPALAESRQTANQTANCRGGDANGGDDVEDGEEDDSGDGEDARGADGRSGRAGDCSIQSRRVQQRAGGDVSRSINQSQSFGRDSRVRSNSDDEDDERDERGAQSASCDGSDAGRACATEDDEPKENKPSRRRRAKAAARVLKTLPPDAVSVAEVSRFAGLASAPL